MQVQQLDHLNMNVSNLARSVQWYADVFGFSEQEAGVYRGRPWRILRSGNAMLALYEVPGLADGESAESAPPRLNHFALRIVDRKSWEQTMQSQQVKVEYDGEIKWPHSTSWYVLDPDGNEIEVVLWAHNQIRFG